MSKTEIEFRARIVYRTWRAVEAGLGRSKEMPMDYRRLTPRRQNVFRAAALQNFPGLDLAYKQHRARRTDDYKSPFREAGLSVARALGRGRIPRS